ncbi:hypothetical protein KC336_g26 [Hortaea werneckii]|nr:hypothetical protein KC336_g26 [Hortaea werneckii]
MNELQPDLSSNEYVHSADKSFTRLFTFRYRICASQPIPMPIHRLCRSRESRSNPSVTMGAPANDWREPGAKSVLLPIATSSHLSQGHENDFETFFHGDSHPRAKNLMSVSKETIASTGAAKIGSRLADCLWRLSAMSHVGCSVMPTNVDGSSRICQNRLSPRQAYCIPTHLTLHLNTSYNNHGFVDIASWQRLPRLLPQHTIDTPFAQHFTAMAACKETTVDHLAFCEAEDGLCHFELHRVGMVSDVDLDLERG